MKDGVRYAWVNTLLLGFVVVALISGYFGLTNGDPGKAWILSVHASVAYAIVAVLAWKAVVVARSLRRNRVAGTPRMVFLVMAALFVFVLTSGLVWAKAGRVVLSPVSLIELHQWTAIAVATLLTWHVVARRWVWTLSPSRDRRAFLRIAAGSTAGLILWQGSAAFARLAGLPGVNRRFTGSYETGSFTGAFPRVSWALDDPAAVSRDDWRLVVDGAVQSPLVLDFDRVASLARDELEATLDCTGGWYSTQVWTGIRVARLLDMAAPGPGWRSIEVESVTGYSRRFSAAEAGTMLLAVSVAGRELSHGHGAPLRLVVPDHRGFDWVKWVRRIRVHESSELWQPPLPLP